MRRIIPAILLTALLLSGCAGWLDASYHNVIPFEPEGNHDDSHLTVVSSYPELIQSLQDLVASGTQSAIIAVPDYERNKIEQDMHKAIKEVLTTDPVAAYAVESIAFELGTNAGQRAMAVDISYLHDRPEILKISHLQTMEDAKDVTGAALDNCSAGVVLYIDQYEQLDLEQWVQDYAVLHPNKVMEAPQVSVNVYPETGEARVLEIKFSYQTSRDALRLMQEKVGSLFDAAVIYAGDNEDPQEQYYKLYSFLMGLFQEFRTDSSITPAYSLLHHGVGDSKAFASVYASMCQEIGLECITVTGMRYGTPCYWNIVKVGESYYHVDLPQCRENEEFVMRPDSQMNGYVWDYSAYPACVPPEVTQ